MEFRPTAPLENLRKRAEVLRLIRRFFEERNFVEVQTPILSVDTIVDRYVEPIFVTNFYFSESYHEIDPGKKIRFLQTSPEFAMKRLLAAGMEAIFQICPVFRQGDRGQFHNVEFTMLEWYRTGDDYQAGMNFLADLVRFVFETIPFRNEKPIPEIELKSYRQVFEERIGANPHTATYRELQAIADFQKIIYPDSFFAHKNDSVNDVTEHWLDLLFSELIQPKLKSTIVFDFPASQSQLAQTRTVRENGGQNNIEFSVTERFELFLGGMEIANGYHELLDAAELRRRFQEISRQRNQDGRLPLPIESRLLAAMEFGLPPSSGTALGLERLLMFLLDADSIDQVLAFPIEIA